MTDQTELKPPPEYAHLPYHWLCDTRLIASNSVPFCEPMLWHNGIWWGMARPTPLNNQHHRRYHGPCDPAAVTIDAGNDRQLAAVRREIESVCSDGNSDVSRVAKNILTALANL